MERGQGAEEGRGWDEFTRPRYGEWAEREDAEKKAARGGKREERREREREKKSNPNNFYPLGAEMQIADQRGLDWKRARLGGNIIKPGLYICMLGM